MLTYPINPLSEKVQKDPVSHIPGFKGSLSFSVLNQVIFYTMDNCSLGKFPMIWSVYETEGSE